MSQVNKISTTSGVFAVERIGRGDPALLLHGIPGDRRTFARVGLELARTYELIIPDLLGFGDSSPYKRDGHAEEQAGALVHLLDVLGLPSVHLVGYDFGGPIAVRLAARAPEKVRTLALLATNVFTDNPVPWPLRIAKVPGLGEAFFRVAFSRFGLEQLWIPAVGDKQALTKAEFRQALGSANSVTSTRHIFLHSLRHLERLYADVEAALPTIEAPRLVLWGDRDPFFSAEAGRRTARAFGDAPFELLTGAGHFLPLERPAEVARALKSLWA